MLQAVSNGRFDRVSTGWLAWCRSYDSACTLMGLRVRLLPTHSVIWGPSTMVPTSLPSCMQHVSIDFCALLMSWLMQATGPQNPSYSPLMNES